MHSVIVSLIRGFVRVRLRGGDQEQLLNRMVGDRMIVWNISRLEDELELDMHLGDFFRLRSFLKETGCRPRVIGRFGLPFVLARLERRKFLAGGLVLFVLGLYMLSSVIWSVQVVGTERLSEQEVLQIAKRQGIHPIRWKYRLGDLDALSARMVQQIPGAAWIGITLQGTNVRIEVVESTLPEERKLLSPRHLVSTSDAVVTEIYAEQGKPVVRRNTRVAKGDILISGMIGSEEHGQVVVAKGEVKGLVWHEYEIEVPLAQTRKGFTGQTQHRFYVVFGNRALQITGYGQEEYERQEVASHRSQLKWRNWVLPFGWIQEERKEVHFHEQQLTKEQAKSVGLTQARADITAKFGKEARIHDEKILHEAVQNGKVYMKVLFEVEQVISEEQPIIHLDTDIE